MLAAKVDFMGRMSLKSQSRSGCLVCMVFVTNIGALMISIGFWGPLYYNYNDKEPPKSSIGNHLGSYINILYQFGSDRRVTHAV